MKVTEIKHCRVCTETSFTEILNLGTQKIANCFHDGSEEVPEAPLELIRCNACSMVQLRHSVDTDAMYRRYWYRSGVNRTMRDHLHGIADCIMDKTSLSCEDIVIDIGCNDGTLLDFFPPNTKKIGVDPSNIGSPNCIRLNTYFTASAVKPVMGEKKAKVVSSIAMFYDLDNPKSFVDDIRSILADDGLWVLELSYLPRMIENTAYDSVCHEHVAYYSLRTFMKVIEGSGLSVIDVQFNDINGGSFRIFLSPSQSESLIVEDIIAKENKTGYETEKPYTDFKCKVYQSRDDLKNFLDNAKKQGKKVYGYGASTKGQVVLQFCGLNSSHMTCIAERNSDKYDLYTPGSNIRICSEEEMREAKPDYLIMFPWYFFEEFKERENSILQDGCKFVLPLPSFLIYG